jgi:2-polyprenyl-3-methyl-5-hydroxy-6-metoxy-1,4-benzoquinol methylase
MKEKLLDQEKYLFFNAYEKEHFSDLATAIYDDLPEKRNNNIKILDLGGGDGNFMNLFLTAFKQIYHQKVLITSTDKIYKSDFYRENYAKLLKNSSDKNLELHMHYNDFDNGLAENITDSKIVIANYVLHHLEDWRFILHDLCSRFTSPWYLIFSEINSSLDNFMEGDLPIEEDDSQNNWLFGIFMRYFKELGLKRCSQKLSARNSKPIINCLEKFARFELKEMKYEVKQTWDIESMEMVFEKELFRRISFNVYKDTIKKQDFLKPGQTGNLDYPAISVNRVCKIYVLKIFEERAK